MFISITRSAAQYINGVTYMIYSYTNHSKQDKLASSSYSVERYLSVIPFFHH